LKMRDKPRHDQASLLFESLVAIVITTLLLTALYAGSHNALRVMQSFEKSISVNLRALNFQRFLDYQATKIRQPFWEKGMFWSYDEVLAVPWFVVHNAEGDAVFSSLRFSNREKSLEVFQGATPLMDFPGFALEEVTPLLTAAGEVRGILLITSIDGETKMTFTLPFPNRILTNE
jgi:cell division protein FtsX